ncbi:MAG TPA: hypothetical protein VM260_00025, partial [Pirellula sp.]|nr:hypothetical protein [Pirellula sp.]
SYFDSFRQCDFPGKLPNKPTVEKLAGSNYRINQLIFLFFTIMSNGHFNPDANSEVTSRRTSMACHTQ